MGKKKNSNKKPTPAVTTSNPQDFLNDLKFMNRPKKPIDTRKNKGDKDHSKNQSVDIPEK